MKFDIRHTLVESKTVLMQNVSVYSTIDGQNGQPCNSLADWREFETIWEKGDANDIRIEGQHFAWIELYKEQVYNC